MEVYIEPLDAAAHLYLIGAGHVSYHLAQAASQVNFKIHVIDDREKFANQERFPDATEIAVDDIPSWLTSATFPNNAYVVILTRGHTHDLDALRALVPRDLRYLGLIGSRAKVARLYAALQEESVPLDTLTNVHAPVGLDIGAVSPQEIAISILAELIAVKYGKAADVAPLRWAPDIDQTATVSANEQQ